MARPRALSKSSKAKKSRRNNAEDLASLTEEVLRLRLQALNLPITGNKAALAKRLKSALHPAIPPHGSTTAGRQPTKRRKKAPAKSKRSLPTPVPATTEPEADSSSSESENVGDDISEKDAFDDFFEADETHPQQSLSPVQLAAIESTVASTLDRALQSYLNPRTLPSLGPALQYTGVQPRRPGTATPLGLHRPLDRNLEDKILRGEYVDFTSLLPDSLARPQAPELQFRMEDSSPGSHFSPLTMVRRRKPTIDTFHKWVDAYTTYMLIIVAAHPRRSTKLLKYQQIISRAETQFQGLAWVTYDEQFRRRAANDLTISWDEVDLELWTVTFSGLAKPHCLTCCSPYHSQNDCPSADPSRRPSRGAVCFRFNRASGCTASTCHFPHVCRRCRSANHSILNCPAGVSKGGSHSHQSSSSRDRSKR